MDKESVLNDIFNNDEFDILNVRQRSYGVKNADERLVASFDEVNEFFEKYQQEPEPNLKNVS